jgi:ABC-type phosphate transport system substrate-binding protein
MKAYTYILTGLLSVCFFLTAFQPKPGDEFAVIIHKDNPINTLTVSEAKLYYLRKLKKRWAEINKNIRPADRKTACPEQNAFYSKVLAMPAAEVEKYFTGKQLQSAERPPDKFTSDTEMINFVASEPGAIGYVSLKSLSGENKDKVKVVLQF